MFKLKIVPDGGEPIEVLTTSRDIVRWESSGRDRSVGKLGQNVRMTDITDLAWFAASRRGLTDLDIRQWREQVDIDFEFAEAASPDGDGDGDSTSEDADPDGSGPT